MEGVDYQAFYTAQGLEPKKTRGDEWECLCPFHEDTKPSFNLNLRTGQWQCHACGEKGNEVSFYAKLHGVSNIEAVRAIRTQMGGGTNVVQLRRSAAAAKPAAPPKAMDRRLADEAEARLLKSKEPLKWLKKARGLTLETIQRFHLGLNDKGDRITIPVFDETGALLNLRLYDWRHTSDQKFLNSKGFGAIRLWPTESLVADEVLLVEGEPDCLTACQLGYAGLTGTGGASNWKGEWTAQLAGKRVAILYDADTAGKEGREKVARALAGTAREVRLVDLPLAGTKEEKDLTDFVVKKGGTKEDLDRLIAEAQVYQPQSGEAAAPGAAPEPEAEVEQILKGLPDHIDFMEHKAAYEQIINKVARMRPSQRDYYVGLLKERFKFSKQAIREEIRRVEMALAVEPAIPAALTMPRALDMSLAQDLRGDAFHYLIYVSTNKGTFVPRLVTSDRQLLEPPEELGDEIPEDTNRWSLDKQTPYNLFEFLAGKGLVRPVELFAELESFVRRYMWYSDERLYRLIPLWIMETYIFMVFDEIGYLALVGTKRTGKTRLFEILEMLSFNAIMSASSTDAYIYRTVERARATLLFDEADSLRKAPKEAVNERLEIIRSGYKRFGKVGRCEGENSRTVQFSTYSMKAIANVTGLEEALEDRVIHVNVERKPKEIPVEKMLKRELRDEVQVLRNKLYFWGLQHASAVAAVYRAYRPQGLEDREAEIWGGLLSIAQYIDQTVHDHVLTLAIDNRKRKELREGLESYEAQLLIALWDLVNQNGRPLSGADRDFFPAELVRDHLLEALGWETLTFNRLANDLVKLRVIEDTAEFKRRLTASVNGKTRKRMCYRLDMKRIEIAAQKYSVQLEEREQPAATQQARAEAAPAAPSSYQPF